MKILLLGMVMPDLYSIGSNVRGVISSHGRTVGNME